MIIHRFVFLAPVQLPGKAPAIHYEPAAAGTDGHTVTRTPDGWLFRGPPGQTSGLSTSGRDELAAIGHDLDRASLAVMVPHSQVIVQYAGQWLDGEKLPESAPSDELDGIRAKARAEAKRKIETPPVAQPGPPPAPVTPPPAASRRRAPAGMAAPPPPPPSVGWVDES